MSNPIGNIGTVPTITIGGTTLTGNQIPAGGTLIVLHGKFHTATGTCTLRKGAATSGYQVTSGKTLTIYAMHVWTASSSGAFGTILAQSDNDVGFDGTTALTNPVYMGTQSFAFLSNTSGTGDYLKQYSLAFPVAATKYASIGFDTVTASASAHVAVIAFGYEA